MKLFYEDPSAELIHLDVRDVITASSYLDEGNNEDVYRPGIDGGLPSILWEDETGSNA